MKASELIAILEQLDDYEVFFENMDDRMSPYPVTEVEQVLADTSNVSFIKTVIDPAYILLKG